MVWPWPSGSPAKPDSHASEPPSTATSTSIPTSTPTITSTPTPTSPPIALTPTPTPTPSEPPTDPDAEFHAAFPHLAPATTATPSPPQAASTSDPSTTPTPTPNPTAPSRRNASHPTTMSCRAAFDSAFYCTSFAGKFNHIYRYGETRSCSEHWSDWRFCMSLKGKSAASRREHIVDRYMEKEERLRAGANSEDVWRVRGEGEEVVRPFGGGVGEEGR